MSALAVTVVGLQDVQRLISEAPRSLVANGFAKAISAACNVFADEVETRCPVKAEDTGGLLDKGELREMIMVAIQIDSQFRGGLGQVGFGDKGGRVANFVEYGHRIVIPGGSYVDSRGRRRKGTPVGDVPAHPFVRPAFDAAVDAALDAFVSSISATCREIFP